MFVHPKVYCILKHGDSEADVRVIDILISDIKGGFSGKHVYEFTDGNLQTFLENLLMRRRAVHTTEGSLLIVRKRVLSSRLLRKFVARCKQMCMSVIVVVDTIHSIYMHFWFLPKCYLVFTVSDHDEDLELEPSQVLVTDCSKGKYVYDYEIKTVNIYKPKSRTNRKCIVS